MFAVIVTIAGGGLWFGHYVDQQFGVQAAHIAVLESKMLTIELQASAEVSRRAAWEAALVQKMDTANVNLGSMSTDLALLRRDLYK